MTIPVQKLRSKLAYDPETGRLTWVAPQKHSLIGTEAGHPNNRGYLGIHLGEGRILCHRAAWAIHYGEWPKGQVDHINGDKTDNRIANLRLATNAQNSVNAGPRGGAPRLSRFKGVTFNKGRWTAQISAGRVHKNLGRFDDEVSAARAYDKAAAEMHGEFARTNAMLGLLCGEVVR